MRPTRPAHAASAANGSRTTVRRVVAAITLVTTIATVAITTAAAVVVLPVVRPAGALAVPGASGAWVRPVDGAVVRAFDAPDGPYGAGHRGVDLAAAPGTPVRAAGDGVVVFAGVIAGTSHVTVLHDSGLRTSYSFLRDVSVRAGREVSRGDVVGASGGTGGDHDGSVLHFGLRLGERYLDPMLLFAPVDLTAVVHLAPAGETADGSWSPAVERRALARALALPVPGVSAAGSALAGEVGSCGSGVPLVGAALDAVCDVGGWVGGGVTAAVDAGLDALHAATGIAEAALASLRAPAVRTLRAMRSAAVTTASTIARTPAGQVALDLVEMGRRFARGVTAECSTDAPPADGTGGSMHRVMVVAGISSSGRAGDRGATVDLDVAALGYREAEGEVRWFSYAADGGSYTADDTYGPIAVAARRLRAQLRAMEREQPGREVDLVAHSQGGVVVDYFLTHLYHSADPSLPPLGNVVTLSTPHRGAPLATAARAMDGGLVGRRVLDGIDALGADLPPADSAAVRDLAERSPLMQHLWDHGLPDHVDFTTIGAPEDVVVPANRISVPGATETVQPVDALNQHHEIVRDPTALRAVRAALEHRAPPCVGLATALRSAVAPVVISRTEQSVGKALAGGLEVRTG
jgi:murein DD-endopeptidase MepM/ murein hydrolase activator NlpD